ncbi:MAG: hypothetical protein ACR2KG_05145 [Nocardioidaceae bacterium]
MSQTEDRQTSTKSARPLWRKPWFIVLGVIVVILLVAVAFTYAPPQFTEHRGKAHVVGMPGVQDAAFTAPRRFH